MFDSLGGCRGGGGGPPPPSEGGGGPLPPPWLTQTLGVGGSGGQPPGPPGGVNQGGGRGGGSPPPPFGVGSRPGPAPVHEHRHQPLRARQRHSCQCLSVGDVQHPTPPRRHHFSLRKPPALQAPESTTLRAKQGPGPTLPCTHWPFIITWAAQGGGGDFVWGKLREGKNCGTPPIWCGAIRRGKLQRPPTVKTWGPFCTQSNPTNILDDDRLLAPKRARRADVRNRWTADNSATIPATAPRGRCTRSQKKNSGKFWQQTEK